MTKPRTLHLAAVAVAVATVALTAAVARPAQALPSYKSDCSSCHSVAPVGTVAVTPSKTTLTPSEAYTVGIGVDLGASGRAGYWLANNDALTPAVGLTGGPATSPFTANLTAPATAGTYTYLVWGAKGKPSSGQALMTTFQITVAETPGGGTGGGGTVAAALVAAVLAAAPAAGRSSTPPPRLRPRRAPPRWSRARRPR